MGLPTRLRHGKLRRFSFLWTSLRLIYRVAIKVLPGFTVSKHIGPYGPFRLHNRFAFSNFQAWGANHNRGFQACIEAARGKTCVMDIGAHIGLVTLPLSKVIAKTGIVFAFEPAKANATFLKEHLLANGIENVEVITDLVGSEELDSVRFFESANDSGMNTIASSGSGRGYGVSLRRQVTLDKFCTDRNLSPELIKIDTEGAEVGILKGAFDTLRRCRPIMFLSVHPRHIVELGSTVDELERLLIDLDYKVTDMNGDEVRPTDLTEYIVSPR